MSMQSRAILLAAFLGLALPGTALAARNEAKDVDAIRKIVESVRTSIIDKDKATFLGLFVSDDPREVNWRSVVDDAWLARIRETKPDAKKTRYLPQVNHVSFIESIASSKKSSEEKFSNIRIDTDGEIASVDFDYAFLTDGRQTNRGREMWQLLRTEGGWKIVSVIWSVRDPLQE
ncbi:MAG: nuclear transport factor 2 family protein [Pseudoxanthomonas sp.]